MAMLYNIIASKQSWQGGVDGGEWQRFSMLLFIKTIIYFIL